MPNMSPIKLMECDDDEDSTLAEGQESQVSVASGTRTMRAFRRFKDTVHDYMPFSRAVCAIIDTPQFQRLRSIKQLGTSYYVWPGAAHNRFEHCLGVAYLANQMAEHLRQSQPELAITSRDVKCVTIAGLCHDLGHGPWSHVWDGVFIPKALPGVSWKHEDASDMMFDDLVKENGLEIPSEDVTFIKALILGEPSKCKGRQEKQFLFEIVANKRNGLDVDKFDYIARDMQHIDQKGMSLTRLIYSARVIDNQICYDIKDANQIYELCYTRFSLHKRIYNHKTAKAIEYMIVDGLLAAEPHMHFAKDIFDPKKFLFLTDDLRTRIESTTTPELAEARAILHRIHKRDLYKPVDFKVFPWSYKNICKEHFTPERIAHAAKADSGDDADPAIVAELVAKHVIVDLAKMHYGMQDKNPLDYVKFYSKHHPNTSQQANAADITLLMPEVFGEVLLRVYTRESRFYGLIQAGYRTLLATVPEPLPDPLDLPEATPPPELPPPSTPPRQKRILSRTQSASARLFSGSFTPSLSQNNFTAVPKNYAGRPESPTRVKGAPQKRDRSRDVPYSPPAKRKKL